MKTILSRSSNSFRPLESDKIGTLINILFHNGEKVVYESTQGWLEAKMEKYGQDIVEIELQSLRKANKIDFTKKDNFYITNRGSSWNKGTELYIYAGEEVVITEPKEFLALETETEKNYLYEYTVNGLRVKIRENTYDKNTDTHGKIEKYLTEFKLHSRGYHKQTLTSLGEKVERITAAIKEKSKVDISAYDIERILEHFDIVEK